MRKIRILLTPSEPGSVDPHVQVTVSVPAAVDVNGPSAAKTTPLHDDGRGHRHLGVWPNGDAGTYSWEPPPDFEPTPAFLLTLRMWSPRWPAWP